MDAQDSARAANSRVVFIRSERSVSRSVPARGRGRRFGYEWVSFHRRILERRLSRVRARSASTGSMERRSEEHTSELQSRLHLVCRLLLEKKKKTYKTFNSSFHRTISKPLPDHFVT